MTRTLYGNWQSKEVRVNSTIISVQNSIQYLSNSFHGFDWGMISPATTQLAFAIIFEITHNVDNAMLLYIEFAKDFLYGLPRQDFVIEFDLEKWVGLQFIKAFKNKP
jgi:hypothetical protein